MIIAKCDKLIILQRLNICDNCIVSTLLGNIGDLLKYCPTLVIIHLFKAAPFFHSLAVFVWYIFTAQESDHDCSVVPPLPINPLLPYGGMAS